MIKAVVSREGGSPVIVVGISEGNVRNLKAGKPILIQTEIGEQLIEFLIMYGETEEAILREVQSHGVRIPTVAIETEEGHKKHVHG